MPGANHHAGATTFTVRAPHADRVELCLFDGPTETRHVIQAVGGGYYSARLPGVGPGQPYGYRVHGDWDAAAGVFSNPAKLLLDPYARLIAGDLRPSPALVTHRPRLEDVPDGRDNAGFVPRSVVADTTFDWGSDRLPNHPWELSLIYETHVKGMTMRHPSVPSELRGTYAGLATPPVIEHLLALGVTAVELLPVHYSITEPWLSRRGLSNYWGYSSIGFFAPNPFYAAGADPISELKATVKALHASGLEVILDVVYNHTGEGNHLGPTLSFRGFDNPGFYRLNPDDRRRYLDWTGTGNSVDQTLPWALEVTLDSLRYWAHEMHIDGFRFDLATSLGRRHGEFDSRAPLFEAIAADPALSSLKLIAEPWDLGPGGYRLGGFPRGWREWNGKFRDDVRDFWRNGDNTVAALARRLSASPDLFGEPTTSINFITAHDGFTVSDLVSYNHKHNHANREHNRDGESHNRSWNSGHEGPTDQADVRDLRRTRAESLLATLFLARGVPMLLGGDELGRTQGGNNNAYGQDNEVSWFNWEEMDWERTAFIQRLAALRRRHPVLHRAIWLTGGAQDDGLADIRWYRPDGRPMAQSDWHVAHAHTLMVFLNGTAVSPEDASFLLLFNSRPVYQTFGMPPALAGHDWETVVDTGHTLEALEPETIVAPFALVVARHGGAAVG